MTFATGVVTLSADAAAGWSRRAVNNYLRVYPERVVVIRGLLSRQEKEVFCGDIRTINVSQGLFQRIIGIGDLQIASAGTGGYEIDAYGLPNPRGIKDLILENKRRSSRTED